MGFFMAIKTTLEQLEEVQAAITQVMTSQSQGGPEGSITRADLKDLQEREAILLERYRIEQGSGGPSINIGTMRRD